MGTFSDKNLLKLVYFIIKSSCYNSQIEEERRPDFKNAPKRFSKKDI
jgi:hypothetical protein